MEYLPRIDIGASCTIHRPLWRFPTLIVDRVLRSALLFNTLFLEVICRARLSREEVIRLEGNRENGGWLIVE